MMPVEMPGIADRRTTLRRRYVRTHPECLASLAIGEGHLVEGELGRLGDVGDDEEGQHDPGGEEREAPVEEDHEGHVADVAEDDRGRAREDLRGTAQHRRSAARAAELRQEDPAANPDEPEITPTPAVMRKVPTMALRRPPPAPGSCTKTLHRHPGTAWAMIPSRIQTTGMTTKMRQSRRQPTRACFHTPARRDRRRGRRPSVRVSVGEVTSSEACSDGEHRAADPRDGR